MEDRVPNGYGCSASTLNIYCSNGLDSIAERHAQEMNDSKGGGGRANL